MQRYFFHLKDGHTALDSEGTELVDLDAARQEAVRFSGEVLREGTGDSLWQGEPWEPWRLWVTDQPDGKGKIFFHPAFFGRGGSSSDLRVTERGPPPVAEAGGVTIGYPAIASGVRRHRCKESFAELEHDPRVKRASRARQPRLGRL